MVPFQVVTCVPVPTCYYMYNIAPPCFIVFPFFKAQHMLLSDAWASPCDRDMSYYERTAEKYLERLLGIAEDVKKNGRQGISVINLSTGVLPVPTRPTEALFQRMRKRPPRYPGFTLIEWANSRDFNRA